MNERVGGEQGGFPDKAIAPGRQQNQQHAQRGEHRQQPQAVYQQAEQPPVEALTLQQHQQRWRQVRGLGIAGKAFA
ncbi:hypothetical protein D9M73_175790 [compost metagenome]